MGWRDTIAPDTHRKDRKNGKDCPSKFCNLTDSSDSSGDAAFELQAAAGTESHEGEARRQRVLAMFAAGPATLRLAAVTEDDSAHPGFVVIGLGLRQDGGQILTADLIVTQERYDGFRLIDLIDAHTKEAPCFTPSQPAH